MSEQKVILITGGNRGIGFEICRQLGALGHIVILCSRNLMKGEKAAESLEGDIRPKKLDVTDPMAMRALADKLGDELGHVDVLINNAGIIDSGISAAESDPTEVKSILETNLMGPWNMVHYFLPLLKKSTDPRVINISSGMGSWSELTGGYAPYRISKSGLNALTLLLSHELAGNIRVNAMCPGWVRTDMGGPNASRDVETGAETAVWLATDPHIPNGKFLRDKRVIEW